MVVIARVMPSPRYTKMKVYLLRSFVARPRHFTSLVLVLSSVKYDDPIISKLPCSFNIS